jgi:hypothetical protein
LCLWCLNRWLVWNGFLVVNKKTGTWISKIMKDINLVWLACMQQNVGALRMLGKCSTRYDLDDLDYHGIGTCEMWARVEGTKIIPTDATGRCVARLCYLCGGVECMSQLNCSWRGHVYSWANYSKWLWVSCLCVD